MKKIFVVLFVTVPLATAALFITNSIVSETFPFFNEPIDNSEFLEQTFQAAKEYCKNISNSEVTQDQSYEECIEMVDDWFENNPYK